MLRLTIVSYNNDTVATSPSRASRANVLRRQPMSAFKLPQVVLDRLFARVEKTDSCWIWKGAITSHGYGILEINGRRFSAHRISFLLAGKVIPEGKQIDHLCRVRRCVNPDHMEAVTSRENTLRGLPFRQRKTHCANGHEYTRETSYYLKKKPGSRMCRICIKLRNQSRQPGFWRRPA